MAGFITRDDILAEADLGKVDELSFYFDSRNGAGAAGSSQGSGLWLTCWTGAAPATTPGTVYNSDQTTPLAGSLWLPDRSTDKKYLLSLMLAGGSATTSYSLMIYDKLAAVSGVSLATTGAKTVNSGALSRYSGSTDAINNEVWIEMTTACTTTAPVINLNQYTSADGTTGQSGGSITLSATEKIGSMRQLPMSATKQGVRSVEVGLNVGTASATGICNVIILRRLAMISANIEGGQTMTESKIINYLDDLFHFVEIKDNATIAAAILYQTAGNTANLAGLMQVVYG